MLRSCFSCEPNARRRQPSRRLVELAPEGVRFEEQAFAALFANRATLGIRNLWRCYAARVDGLIETVEGEMVLVEAKEVLGWGAVSGALFEFLAGRSLLGVSARRGIIVFARMSDEWSAIEPRGAWGQLALHSQEVSSLFEMGGLQVSPDGRVYPPPENV